jgi:hypothetical protein
MTKILDTLIPKLESEHDSTLNNNNNKDNDNNITFCCFATTHTFLPDTCMVQQCVEIVYQARSWHFPFVEKKRKELRKQTIIYTTKAQYNTILSLFDILGMDY